MIRVSMNNFVIRPLTQGVFKLNQTLGPLTFSVSSSLVVYLYLHRHESSGHVGNNWNYWPDIGGRPLSSANCCPVSAMHFVWLLHSATVRRVAVRSGINISRGPRVRLDVVSDFRIQQSGGCDLSRAYAGMGRRLGRWWIIERSDVLKKYCLTNKICKTLSCAFFSESDSLNRNFFDYFSTYNCTLVAILYDFNQLWAQNQKK